MTAQGQGTAQLERAITFRWDLDKTYLKTEFESLRKMMRIPFEAASDKVHLPGVPELIRSLRRCAGDRGERPYVFFLSASPPQIGAAIKQKLELDGIEYDGIIFKDQLRNLIRGKWRTLREQIGYKLGELLESRVRGPAAEREVLFGDDWESDPLIYSLYADLVSAVISPAEAEELLRMLEVERRTLARVVEAATALAASPATPVERIYINLERRTPPERFRAFGPRLVPAFNYFQTGASLFEQAILDVPAVVGIATALLEQQGYTPERLRNSLDDLVRRGHLKPASRLRLISVLRRDGLVSAAPHERRLRERLRAQWEGVRRLWRRRRRGATASSLGPEKIDYRAIVLGGGTHR